MRSPFPGMDPFEEQSDLWMEFHNPLVIYARDMLHSLLPDNYIAQLEFRTYTERGVADPQAPKVRRHVHRILAETGARDRHGGGGTMPPDDAAWAGALLREAGLRGDGSA